MEFRSAGSSASSWPDANIPSFRVIPTLINPKAQTLGTRATPRDARVKKYNPQDGARRGPFPTSATMVQRITYRRRCVTRPVIRRSATSPRFLARVSRARPSSRPKFNVFLFFVPRVSRHCYATKSNRIRKLHTPGGKLTVQYVGKKTKGPQTPSGDLGKIHGESQTPAHLRNNTRALHFLGFWTLARRSSPPAPLTRCSGFPILEHRCAAAGEGEVQQQEDGEEQEVRVPRVRGGAVRGCGARAHRARLPG